MNTFRIMYKDNRVYSQVLKYIEYNEKTLENSNAHSSSANLYMLSSL